MYCPLWTLSVLRLVARLDQLLTHRLIQGGLFIAAFLFAWLVLFGGTAAALPGASATTFAWALLAASS